MINRRQILATTGFALSTSVAGCITDTRRTTGDSPITPAPGTPPSSSGDCGPAERSVSELLTAETGDSSYCPEAAEPSLAVENERDEHHTVTVELSTEEGFTESYTLDPDERAVESTAFRTEAEISGTVRIDDDERYSVTWPDRSCFRHGIALTPDGIEIGWIEPLSGPGDTQHDCYAADTAQLRLISAGKARTVTVTVADRCANSESTKTVELAADEVETSNDTLTNGGMYTLTVDVHDGGSETYDFHETCWGVSALVDEAGEIRMENISID